MKPLLDFIDKFTLILLKFLKKSKKLIIIYCKKIIANTNKFIKKHQKIKNEFDPLIKEKHCKNVQLSTNLTILKKTNNDLSNKIKHYEFKNKSMEKKLEILSELIINK